MAKSARASGIKKNNQALKKRVFGPVESARNERLSAKLLELAQQPKPLRPEMEVEQETGEDKHTHVDRYQQTETDVYAETKDADSEAKEKGVSRSSTFAIPIPLSMSRNMTGMSPSYPAIRKIAHSCNGAMPVIVDSEHIFFHFLGLSKDVLGFDVYGNLQLSFTAKSGDDVHQ